MLSYLDHNATTPLDERVLEVMLPYLRDLYGNPSSIHAFGRRARAALDKARAQVAQLVNVQTSQVLFTSGGTESNNLILKSILSPLWHTSTPPHLAISRIEHPSSLQAVQFLQTQGTQIEWLPVTTDGQVDLAQIRFNPATCLASVMWANNETGVIQPIAEIAQLAHAQGIPLHTDASQAVGKIPVDFTASQVNFMTVCGHKFYAPQGVGALIVDKRYPLEPLLHGGGQENGLRGGTENLAAIVGFGHAAELAYQELPQRIAHVRTLQQQLETALQQIPEVRIIGETASRLPNTTLLTVEGFSGETLLMELDKKGIAASSGSACHSAHAEPSHVLLAMGLSAETALSTIRISLGKQNTAQDIEYFIKILKQLINEFKQLCSLTHQYC